MCDFDKRCSNPSMSCDLVLGSVIDEATNTSLTSVERVSVCDQHKPFLAKNRQDLWYGQVTLNNPNVTVIKEKNPYGTEG